MKKFNCMVEIEWDSKEKALKIANKLIDKAENYIENIYRYLNDNNMLKDSIFINFLLHGKTEHTKQYLG